MVNTSLEESLRQGKCLGSAAPRALQLKVADPTSARLPAGETGRAPRRRRAAAGGQLGLAQLRRGACGASSVGLSRLPGVTAEAGGRLGGPPKSRCAQTVTF